jgi:hypothetical protein
MQINSENYEVFLVDYLDGNLSPEVRLEVEAFLLMHPEIQTECEDLFGFVLPSEHVSFEDKQALKIESDISHVQVLMLRALDGDLSDSEKGELEKVLQDPTHARSFGLLKSTVLQPQHVSFDHKTVLHIPNQLTAEQERELSDTARFPVLQPLNGEHFDKSDLYFPESADLNQDAFLAAAFAEGDLVGSDLQKAKKRMDQSQVFAQDVDALRRMRLVAQPLLMPDKDDLKKKEAKVIAFTPALRRAMAIAAAFLIGIGIWSPWDNQEPEHGAVALIETPKEASGVTENQPVEGMAKATDTQDSNAVETKTPRMLPKGTWSNGGLSHDELAEQVPTEVQKPEQIQQKQPAQDDINPMIIEEEPQIAQQEPKQNPEAPYVPISKDNALMPATPAAPVTLLAFLGDKLEQRIEQSQVYSFLDKKKKEIFDADGDQEPVRYERVKTPSLIKQKLVLWGVEFQRTKRKS